MRFLSLTLAAAALYAVPTLAAFRPELKKNVQVAELEPEQRVEADATEIPLKANPGSDFDIIFICKDANKQFAFTECKRWVACCPPGSRLLGSEDTAFDCCGLDQDLIGSKDTGYKCCAAGQTFDECTGRVEPVTCPIGEILVNDQCFCPPGTYRTTTGICEPLECSSGLLSGKIIIIYQER